MAALVKLGVVVGITLLRRNSRLFGPKKEEKLHILKSLTYCDSICGLRQIFYLKKSVGVFCGNEKSTLYGLRGPKTPKFFTENVH